MSAFSEPIRISFGIIVLNGEPFTRYCLRSLYPFAHEIIVVEGATQNARAISTPAGHSTDATLDTLERFKKEEDPQNKLNIITRNGFWSEKDEMSQAYAKAATGNILWQVDVDEFYKPADMQRVISILENDPAVSTLSFNTLTFWGNLDYLTTSIHHMRGAGEFHRVFRFGPGFSYTTHRPPTVVDPTGRNLRGLGWLRGITVEKKYRIFLYHYSFLFPKQVEEKSIYYSALKRKRKDSVTWAKENYFKLGHPFHVHNVYEKVSWLLRYRGTHPPHAEEMMATVTQENKIDLRDTEDIERLLSSVWYRPCTLFLESLGISAKAIGVVKKQINSVLRGTLTL